PTRSCTTTSEPTRRCACPCGSKRRKPPYGTHTLQDARPWLCASRLRATRLRIGSYGVVVGVFGQAAFGSGHLQSLSLREAHQAGVGGARCSLSRQGCRNGSGVRQRPREVSRGFARGHGRGGSTPRFWLPLSVR